MLTLKKTSYGYKTVATGRLTVTEVATALGKFSRLQPELVPFAYISDQRTLGAMSEQVQVKVRELMGLFLRSGLTQIAIICSSSSLAMQSNARFAGTTAARFSRAFDGSDPLWKVSAMAWVASSGELADAA